ncbi:hypothetical protein KSP40_PGU009676 [Platanthera guangdongensis]|uniref:Uncharacterized protein n=1 Tax=Platanthera guangdongensis TaxID=2320717 RepID=A0ABR2MUM3_9ASPA
MIAEAAPSPEENGWRSSAPEEAHLPTAGNFLGRHRLSAAISRIEQEIRSLEAELEELDAMEPCSAACKDVLSSTIGIPDALLPM